MKLISNSERYNVMVDLIDKGKGNTLDYFTNGDLLACICGEHIRSMFVVKLSKKMVLKNANECTAKGSDQLTICAIKSNNWHKINK